jgi:hypothetical protein
MSHASVFLVAAGGSPHEAGTDQGAGQQAKGTGTYPVDAWLEGREHIENGDDVLMPIQKVESLMNCIALKEIVAQGPETLISVTQRLPPTPISTTHTLQTTLTLGRH